MFNDQVYRLMCKINQLSCGSCKGVAFVQAHARIIKYLSLRLASLDSSCKGVALEIEARDLMNVGLECSSLSLDVHLTSKLSSRTSFK